MDMEVLVRELSYFLLEHLRATLNLQGTDGLHAALHDVLAAGGELHAPTLEMLLVVHGDLGSNIFQSQIVECRLP